MKIVVALKNEFIFERLKEKYKEKIYKFDFNTKEELIEFISKSKEEYIVITKDTLDGKIDSKMYIKQLKIVNKNIKIIYIVENLNSEYKQFLFANEVFNILEMNNLDENVIYEAIEEDKNIVYKEKIIKENNSKARIKNNILAKRKIAVYGTSGSGKSFVSSILSKHISKDLGVSLALLDMDIQNPSIDIFNNINSNNDALSNIIDELDKKKNIDNVIEKFMINDKDNKKLWYMTNNASIFDIQNKFSNKYYEMIYNNISKKFDYTVIDLPSSPFLDVVYYTLFSCDNIFFVINPNYASIRQAIKYLDLLNKLWNIPKEKIKIIVNKMQKNSLENIQIENILDGYEIVLNIPYVKEVDSYINGAISNITLNLDTNKVYEKFGVKNQNFNMDFSFKSILKRVGV